MDERNGHGTAVAHSIRLQSRSPFRTVQVSSQAGLSKSPWSVAEHAQDDGQASNDVGLPPKLHQSEISIFQQLCLDKHDENAAIELLLEDRIPDVLTASSESTGTDGLGSREMSKKKASSVEVKRMFLNRFFFKTSSPQKLPQQRQGFHDATSSAFIAKGPSCCQGEGDDIGVISCKPLSPSMVSRSQSKLDRYARGSKLKANKNSRGSTKYCSYSFNTTNSVSTLMQSDHFDDLSNVSSLSESTLTAHYRPPTRFKRNESMGIESVKDVQTMLKRMDHQLSKASHNGERISREKVMEALFNVADSLEDCDDDDNCLHDFQKELQRIESGNSMDIRVDTKTAQSLPMVAEENLDSGISSSDDDEFSVDRSAFADDIGGYEADRSTDGSSPFNIVSSVENFFGVGSADQDFAPELLDDLTWTDFVCTRQEQRSVGPDTLVSSLRSGSNEVHVKSRRGQVVLNVRRKACHSHDRLATTRGMSWWRAVWPQSNGIVSSTFNIDDDQRTKSSVDRDRAILPMTITIKKTSVSESPC